MGVGGGGAAAGSDELVDVTRASGGVLVFSDGAVAVVVTVGVGKFAADASAFFLDLSTYSPSKPNAISKNSKSQKVFCGVIEKELRGKLGVGLTSFSALMGTSERVRACSGNLCPKA